MSLLDRLLKTLQNSSNDPSSPESGVRGGDDPLVREVTKLACGIAKSCAALTPGATEEAVEDIVIGRINAALHQRTGQVRERAFRAQLDVARAREQEQVADHAAERLDQEANDVEGTAELRSSRVREAKEQLRDLQERIQDLPLLTRVRTPLSLVAIAVLGSAAGVGALAHLSLEAVSEAPTKWTITVAAGCIALAAEIVIGTLSADNYDRTPEEALRWVIPAVLTLVVGLIVGTEIFAAKVRQEGLETTQAFKGVGTALGALRLPLAPSLFWTGPLSVLATITGSGVVGLTRLKESNRTRFENMKDAADRLKAAEDAVGHDEEKVQRLREEATRRREQAAQLRGNASTAQAHSDNLSATLEQMSQKHAQLIRAITQEAKLVYRREAERYARVGEDENSMRLHRTPTLERTLPITVGVSVLAGTLGALITAEVIPGLIMGSVVMIVAALRKTQAAL